MLHYRLTEPIDRFQEARIALGREPFDPYILENMIQVLSPYRKQAHITAKVSLYLSATSLLSKSPLPNDAIIVDKHTQDFIEDAVIVSARMATSDIGAAAVKEGMRISLSIYRLTRSTDLP